MSHTTFCSDYFVKIDVRISPNFRRILIIMEKSFVKWAPAPSHKTSPQRQLISVDQQQSNHWQPDRGSYGQHKSSNRSCLECAKTCTCNSHAIMSKWHSCHATLGEEWHHFKYRISSLLNEWAYRKWHGWVRFLSFVSRHVKTVSDKTLHS